ncbi:MAG TPA: RodZ domain-containing protein, partial [Candidatus Acidoferrales bacterium]
MDKGTFGESLKREREMRGVTLEEISSATRIATRFLQAIENEKWEQLPGGVFNRGFVRAVARYLGLDEENIVAEYTLAVGDRPTVPVWTGSPPAVTAEQPWIAWIGAVVVILLLLSGVWFGTRFFLARRAARRGAQAAAANVASPPANASESQQANADPTAIINSATAQDSVSGSLSGGADTSPGTAPVLSPTDRFELKVEAAKKTKVTVVADKDVVYDGTMKIGENQFFSAADHFQVTAKDAGALHLELNGKPIPPIGPAGHAGKITLTRDALKNVPGGG